MLKFLPIFMTFCFSLYGANEDRVTLSLKKFEQMKLQNEQDQHSVVENLKLSGSFTENLFNLSIKGRYIGKRPEITILKNFSYSLKNCQGDALVKVQSQNVTLVPLKNNFSANCSLVGFNKNNLELHLSNIMYFENKVLNSEKITKRLQGNDIVYNILKKVSQQFNKKSQVVASGKYRLHIGPNSNQFTYYIHFNNPNRNKETYTLNLLNNEILESTHTELQFKEQEKGLDFELNPGINQVILKGKFQGTTFAPLLKTQNQFFALEHHPLLQLKPKTSWRRISNSESQIANLSDNARSYYINEKSLISWVAKTLKTFSSLGFSVKKSHYKYYLPKQGTPIIEASYSIDNQGAPEVPISINGKVMYSELNSKAVPMLQDENENLLVSLKQGVHRVLIQYMPKQTIGSLIQKVKLPLAKPKALTSSSSLQIISDQKWNILYSNFDNNKYSLISSGTIAEVLIWLFFFAIFIKFLKISKQIILPLSLSLTALALLKPSLIFLYYFFMLLCLLTHFRRPLWSWFTATKLRSIAAIGCCGVLALMVLIILPSLTRMSVGKIASMSNNYSDLRTSQHIENESQYLEEASDEGLSVRRKRLMKSAGPGMHLGAGANSFQGIPAKVEIPSGKSIFLSTHMIPATKKLFVSIILVKRFVINSLLLALSLFSLGWIYLKKQSFFTALNISSTES